MTDQLQQQPPARQRRRGEELEAAILDAAWEELLSVGFARLTMESVAARARTGIAVLYRRWPRKNDLVFAALRRYGQMRQVPVPDTGNLRDDMVALLSEVSQGNSAFNAVVMATFTGMLADSGVTPDEVRRQILGDRPLQSAEVFRRAHERGEIDLDRIPPAVLAMPADLMRHDALMTLKPLPRERIVSIVDDLFMPLATMSVRHSRDSGRPG